VRSLFARALLVAIVLAIAPPAAQLEIVAIPDVVSEDLSVRISTDAPRLSSSDATAAAAHRSDAIAAPITFTMVGFRLPEGVDTVRVRAAGDDGVWDEWYELERSDPEDGPDAGTEEAANDRSHEFTEPVFVGESTRFQVEVPAAEVDAAVAGDVDVSAVLLDTEGLSGGPVSRRAVTVEGPVAEASSAPRVVTRQDWGAAAYKGTVSYQDNVDLVVVHHTAGNNTYTQAQAAGIVRGIQSYHQNSQGWSDIGYNMLVDRFGNLYEGRQGGIGRGVVGAHAAGYNTGSFGISVMGNFTNVDAPQAAIETMTDAIAWKAAIHGFNPNGTTNRTAKGARVRTITGHRDVGSTACPGRISNRLGWIRDQAARRAPSMPTTGPGSLPPGRFTDVAPSSYHYGAAVTAHDTNVLLGYAVSGSNLLEYRPGHALNRGDMARAVATGMGLRPASDWRGRFSDVNDQHAHWLGPWIAALQDAGVVEGYPDGTFRPSEALTREQMASFLANALNLPDANPSFVDLNRNSPHYRRVGAVQRHGIAQGITSTHYGPGLSMRRDQSATLLVRTFDLVAP